MAYQRSSDGHGETVPGRSLAERELQKQRLKEIAALVPRDLALQLATAAFRASAAETKDEVLMPGSFVDEIEKELADDKESPLANLHEELVRRLRGIADQTFDALMSSPQGSKKEREILEWLVDELSLRLACTWVDSLLAAFKKKPRVRAVALPLTRRLLPAKPLLPAAPADNARLEEWEIEHPPRESILMALGEYLASEADAWKLYCAFAANVRQEIKRHRNSYMLVPHLFIGRSKGRYGLVLLQK